MKYKSDAQVKFFHANKTKLEKQGVDVKEWDKESEGLELPKRQKRNRIKRYIWENVGNQDTYKDEIY